MAGQAVHPGAEDHPSQRHGLPRLAGGKSVSGLFEICGQAPHDGGRHRHQRQDHRQQYAGGHSGGGGPSRSQQPGGQQHHLRRVHGLHPQLRPAGPGEEVRHGGTGDRRAVGPEDLPLCAAQLYSHHQPVPGLHHAQRPSRLYRRYSQPESAPGEQADPQRRRPHLLRRGGGKRPVLFRHRADALRRDGLRKPAERHAHLPPLRRKAAVRVPPLSPHRPRRVRKLRLPLSRGGLSGRAGGLAGAHHGGAGEGRRDLSL